MRQLPIWKPALVMLVTLCALLYSAPSIMGGSPPWWPSWLPNQVISRGLDLQGGLYLLMQVETDKAVEQSAENLVDEIRGAMRKDRLRYRGVERQGIDSVVMRLSDRSEPEKMRLTITNELPRIKLTEDAGGKTWTLSIKPEDIAEIRKFAVEQSIETIRSRIDQFGVSEPTIQKQGKERILIQLPGLEDPARAKNIIGKTARLEFKMIDEKGDLSSALAGRIPPGDVLLYGEERDRASGKVARQPYLLKKRTVLAGDLLTDARVNFDQFNESYVSINFNRQGSRKFAQLTAENVGKRMAIVLDKQVYSAPVIREKIEGGRAQISGSFTPEDAHDLAIILRAGALPAPVSFLEERTVGPTLGRDSVEQGLNSILIGAVLVLIFMLLYYKGFGLLANIAVVVNVLILMAILTVMQATLTLPGIAGAVLLLGMAVDANVLIFERIREEMRLGKTPMAAIDHGYAKAFSTIVDANITTLITAVVLYQFGTGPVRGFAVTLSIGLLASMFTAIFMTRVILTMFVGDRRLKSLSI